jgi:catechol 2,3-dioxygenase-like lactoylglutathione lyase family enzyme
VQLERISLICDDLERVARFWQDEFGLVGQWTTDPLTPERQVLVIGDGPAAPIEYVWFPGQPGDRGSGDLRRLDLRVGADVWQRLEARIGSGPVDRLPDGRLAVLEPHTGLLIACRLAPAGPPG